MKIKQNKTELQKHFKEHIQFLSMSANAFDKGVEGEAKRIAVSLRVLLHQTSKSHSLLNQLGIKVSFYNTSHKYNPKNLLTHLGLTSMHMENEQAKHVAPLGNRPNPAKQQSFQNWWNEPIIVDNNQNKFSRKKIVLAVANQDGGAHVDPGLDEAYAKLSRENSAGWVFNNGNTEEPIRPVELASIRQICYEVLSTFKMKFPEYFQEDMTI